MKKQKLEKTVFERIRDAYNAERGIKLSHDEVYNLYISDTYLQNTALKLSSMEYINEKPQKKK
jgi:hypothetical protein